MEDNTILLTLFMAFFFLLSGIGLYSYLSIYRKGIKTSAVVVKQVRSGMKSERVFTPYVSIKIDNQLQELPLQVQASKNMYKEGKTIEVRYYKGKVYASMTLIIILSALMTFFCGAAVLMGMISMIG